MGQFKNLYYVEAIIEVPVTISVAANDDQHAFARANDGAWHNVNPHNYDNAKIKAIGPITKGPGLN